MNARRQERDAASSPGLALLGTGTVGSAFVARYQALQARGLELPRLNWLANSRTVLHCQADAGPALRQARGAPRAGTAVPPWVGTRALLPGDLLVDATASDEVAGWHARWLASGVHVVTANKLGTGATLARARDIAAGRAAGAAHYGDTATVGAGLPVLRSLRALREGGDRIHAIEGVLSGSLAWLFNRYDGSQPFSVVVREALVAGYTEPDPREDLSGEDVRRKLLILGRASGLPLESTQILVQSLVPPALAALPLPAALQSLEALDAPLQRRWQQARDTGQVLRFLGRIDADGAQVGLQAVPAGHPLAQGAGTDNRVAIHSDRYRQQPLLIQGPGAGAEVTAAALLDDVLRISALQPRPI